MREMWSDLREHPEHGLFLLWFVFAPVFIVGACAVSTWNG